MPQGKAIAQFEASTQLPIRSRIISYEDTLWACANNNPGAIGWQNEFTFKQACANIRARGELDDYQGTLQDEYIHSIDSYDDVFWIESR